MAALVWILVILFFNLTFNEQTVLPILHSTTKPKTEHKSTRFMFCVYNLHQINIIKIKEEKNSRSLKIVYGLFLFSFFLFLNVTTSFLLIL